MHTFISAFTLVICLVSANLQARVVGDLTRARVPVLDRSDIEFARGTSNALETVLVKLTGNSRTAQTTQGRAVLAKAKRLVQQFGYEKSTSSDGAENLLLRVTFDAPALTEEMRNQGLALWGKERPATRLYVMIKDGPNSSMLTNNMADSDSIEARLAEVILRQANNRGIPVSFPEPAKAALITPNGNLSQALLDALALEQDSDTDGVAVAVFESSSSGLWESQWKFQMGSETGQLSGQGDIADLLAEENTDSLADTIGKRFANPTLLSRKESVRLKIHGIYDASDYARVTRYLGSLDSIGDLFLQQAQGDAIILSALVQGGYQGLGQSIAFGKVLAPLSVDQTSAGISEGSEASAAGPGEYRLISR